jgi:hypothetical protein
MPLEEQPQIMADILWEVFGMQWIAETLSGLTHPNPPHKSLGQLRREQYLQHKQARERQQRQRDLEVKYPGLYGENLSRILEQEYLVAVNRYTKKQKQQADADRRVERAQEKGPIGSPEYAEEMKRLREEDTAADMAVWEAKEAKKKRRSPRKQTPAPVLFGDDLEDNLEENEDDPADEDESFWDE